jgi:purine-binding chemotaxis protein CheW
VAEETYAIPIARVLEILPLMPITRIPRAPDAVLGIINLRGRVVPVFDMHKKLGLPGAVATRNTCVVVVEVQGLERGIKVDAVREVATLRAEDIEPPPTFEEGEAPSEHLVGVSVVGGTTLLLLSLEQFLAANRPPGEAATAPTDDSDDVAA